MANNVIERINVNKYLGLYVDKNTNWNAHVKKNKENNSIHIKVFKRITNICCDEGKNSCTFHLSNRI